MASSSLSPRSSSSDFLAGTEDLESDFSGAFAVAVDVGDSLFHWRRTNQALVLLTPSGFSLEDLSDDKPRHFLDSCFFCKKPLSDNGDIFMYRGDTPFCSKECREEQMEIDEAAEISWKISARKEQLTKKQRKSSASPKSQGVLVRTGTIVTG